MAVLTRLIDAMSAKSTTAESKKEAGLPVSLVRLAIAVSHLARERVMMMTLLVVGSAANWIAHSNPRPTLAPVIAIVLILFSFLLVFADLILHLAHVSKRTDPNGRTEGPPNVDRRPKVQH